MRALFFERLGSAWSERQAGVPPLIPVGAFYIFALGVNTGLLTMLVRTRTLDGQKPTIQLHFSRDHGL